MNFENEIKIEIPDEDDDYETYNDMKIPNLQINNNLDVVTPVKDEENTVVENDLEYFVTPAEEDDTTLLESDEDDPLTIKVEVVVDNDIEDAISVKEGDTTLEDLSSVKEEHITIVEHNLENLIPVKDEEENVEHLLPQKNKRKRIRNSISNKAQVSLLTPKSKLKAAPKLKGNPLGKQVVILRDKTGKISLRKLLPKQTSTFADGRATEATVNPQTASAKQRADDCELSDNNSSPEETTAKKVKIDHNYSMNKPTREIPEMFKCSHCDFASRNKTKLIQHNVTFVHEFLCSLCHEKFTNNASLEKHMKTECQNTKPYACEFCCFRSHKKTNLENHIRLIHALSKPYVCKVCNYRYSQKSYLNNHMRSHSDRLYSCKFCRYQSKDYSVLNTHMQMHEEHKDKPFCCTICNYKYSCNSHLLIHLETHKDSNKRK